jgi:hypothetical protein
METWDAVPGLSECVKAIQKYHVTCSSAYAKNTDLAKLKPLYAAIEKLGARLAQTAGPKKRAPRGKGPLGSPKKQFPAYKVLPLKNLMK